MAELKINLGWQTIVKAVTIWPVIAAIWMAAGWATTNKQKLMTLLDNTPRIIEAVDMVLEVDEDGTPEYDKYRSRMAWVQYQMDENIIGVIEDDLEFILRIECKEHPEECD